jgi:alpha-L-rhamnosidase
MLDICTQSGRQLRHRQVGSDAWGRAAILALLVVWQFMIAGQAFAQVVPRAWSATWIADLASDPAEAGVFHFRRDFDLATRPERFVIHVSADNRYRLFVNGVQVSEGPARGDLMHWRYETVDIGPQLRAGHNVLTALVWNMGQWMPVAQISHRTAFLLEGDSAAEAAVNTGPQWKVQRNPAYSFSPVVGEDSGGYYVAGPGETVDARQVPWGWDRANVDISGWTAAVPIAQALTPGTQMHGVAAEWQLVPREIPPMEQRIERFASLRRSAGIQAGAAFLHGSGGLTVPANAKVSLLIDNGHMTMGYPILRTSGGRDASAVLTYAEGLFDAKGQKGNRNEIEGRTIRGLRDRFIFDGGEGRRFQTLWLRAYRYVQIDIETADEPLQIDDFHTLFTAYPFVERASFDSEAKWLEPIWEMDWRGLRLSAFETFWDTPYYEQLQYVGDTRIEALLSVYLAGDDRLMRQAIEAFDVSRSAAGITMSRYPSNLPQYIPSFSLWWIAMVHDHWMLRDDPQFVRRFLPGTRTVIDWFERQIDETGMVARLPWWNFLDWSEAYPNGVPPGAIGGHATAFTLQFAIVLRQAAELEEALGRPANVARYRALADRLVAAARAKAWDNDRGLFVDSLESRTFSQDTNVLAILAGALPDERRRSFMETVLNDRSLGQATYYFRYYVHEALRESGMGDLYLDQLDPWRTMVANGLTSTAEQPEPTRSDSHAWSAHPNYHLLSIVLGVRPGSPGFRSVMFEPHLGQLRRVSGTVPHAAGEISVQLIRRGATGLEARVDLPRGLPGRLDWKGQAIELAEGVNRIVCDSSCRLRSPAP